MEFVRNKYVHVIRLNIPHFIYMYIYTNFYPSLEYLINKAQCINYWNENKQTLTMIPILLVSDVNGKTCRI